MCACRCGIKVWLTDGKIRYTQGNPAHPVNQGVLCAKGSAGIMQHYSPARLDKPLLRVGERGFGLFARDADGKPLCFDRTTNAAVDANRIDVSPAVVGEIALADGRTAVPSFHLVAERYLDPQYAPDAVSQRCGIPADTIVRIARELAEAAFDNPVTLPIAWTDAHGREHAEMVGRPVAMHAMRGISAHSNGFHTCRALHLLQLLLGAVDTPGSFRYQPPFPKAIPPPNRPGKTRQANGALDAPPLGFVHVPEDLLVDAQSAQSRSGRARVHQGTLTCTPRSRSSFSLPCPAPTTACWRRSRLRSSARHSLRAPCWCCWRWHC